MLVRVALMVIYLAAICYAQGDKSQGWGFVGMRGKKDIGFDQSKRGPTSLGFQGMRGKKDGGLVDSVLDNEIAPNDEFSYDKRSPNMMGFQGVRGKKDGDKRAPSGFMGMRGKKDDYYPNSWFFDEDKRAPSGFFGVRGKKGPSSSSFFGMRGKKGPSSGFFGMRGKKGPSGFLGVRGKKSSDIDSLLQLLHEPEISDDFEELVARDQARKLLEEDDE